MGLGNELRDESFKCTLKIHLISRAFGQAWSVVILLVFQTNFMLISLLYVPILQCIHYYTIIIIIIVTRFEIFFI